MDKKNSDEKRNSIVVRYGETRRKATPYWSPAMDNIVQVSYKKPLIEAMDQIDSKIDRVLYSSNKTRRLPIFDEICPFYSSLRWKWWKKSRL
ncbi:unnamed protein product [Citrullus colocynthis]|uniref:Uncharacterized protein n=1 Tax=Citrullus colocynthis TaxID=252529 RepID=A0ABP0YP37_9ROSI